MTTPASSSKYHELVSKNTPRDGTAPRTHEDELDTIIRVIEERKKQAVRKAQSAPDRIESLRKLTISELIPVFVELMEKYSSAGVSMEMDASNFLEGGRELRFEFGLGEHRTQLLGTVTTEAIAFHETRYSPDVHGELVSGPMLRLRSLNSEVFREFVCERLTILLRGAARQQWPGTGPETDGHQT